MGALTVLGFCCFGISAAVEAFTHYTANTDSSVVESLHAYREGPAGKLLALDIQPSGRPYVIRFVAFRDTAACNRILERDVIGKPVSVRFTGFTGEVLNDPLFLEIDCWEYIASDMQGSLRLSIFLLSLAFIALLVTRAGILTYRENFLASDRKKWRRAGLGPKLSVIGRWLSE
jgi:hypothetical protein